MAKTPTEIASLARSHTRTPIRTLAQIMKQPEAPYAARVAAAEALLDRGWGRPKQSHEAEITHRYVIEIPALMDNATWEAEAIEYEPRREAFRCARHVGPQSGAEEKMTPCAEPKVRVAWSPRGNPAQMRLLKCQVFEIFFGGARGGGKTDGVLAEFGAHASRYGKDAIGLMVRRTRAELVETIERSREIYSPLGWKLNETDKMWRAPDGARLRFAYLERDADADLYQGHNCTRVYVEEVGNFPSPTPVMKLMATLRSGAGVPVGLRATGNPGGPGHQW